MALGSNPIQMSPFRARCHFVRFENANLIQEAHVSELVECHCVSTVYTSHTLYSGHTMKLDHVMSVTLTATKVRIYKTNISEHAVVPKAVLATASLG